MWLTDTKISGIMMMSTQYCMIAITKTSLRNFIFYISSVKDNN